MELVTGNLLIAQSGGPTAVINASLAGLITEALNHECVEEIYGSMHGILGVLREEFIDLAEESQQTIRGLKHTPGAALGTCRYKLKTDADYARILDVFKAHNIRFFFYIGGNDSQDSCAKIAKLAKEQNYEMRVIGVPKTVDNDLLVTDHCPGYASAVKYLCTTIRELACDNEGMGQHDLVTIVEVMGRNAGWLTAGTALARQRGQESSAPHLIYLPEVAFDKERFLEDVRSTLEQNKYCLVAASEGLVDTDGNYVATASGATDAFGHAQLGGVAETLAAMVQEHLGIKARTCRPGAAQRAAGHCASETDMQEAFDVGIAAIEAAVKGETGKMVSIFRSRAEGYASETGLVNLQEVANGVKVFPADWINEAGNDVTFHFNKYAAPLLQGEVQVPYAHGLPEFVQLKKVAVEKQLKEAYAVN